MDAALQALALLLAREAVTVDEVVAHLGSVTHDYGANLLIAPRDASFTEANLVRGLDPATRHAADVPAHVEITPAEPPTIEALSRTFGTPVAVPAEERVPPRAIFYLDLPGQPRGVALIAHVKEGRAVRLTLRRD
jgi:hypothetical protein